MPNFNKIDIFFIFHNDHNTFIEQFFKSNSQKEDNAVKIHIYFVIYSHNVITSIQALNFPCMHMFRYTLFFAFNSTTHLLIEKVVEKKNGRKKLIKV